MLISFAQLRCASACSLALALASAFCGCQFPGPVAGAARNPQLPTATSAATLRPGDSLVITLQGIPDPSSNQVQIDDQGLVTLPFIGPISTSSTTTGLLSQRIREAYLAKKIYMTVDVSVAVTERFIYVGGEVVRPGRIVWTPDLTVTKAIQAAGGFTLYAKETKIALVRERVSHSVNAVLAQKNPAEDPRLVPGDALQVPKSAF
jgi:polysaccharide export outer membrane protein